MEQGGVSGRARGAMTNIQMEAMVGRAVIQFLVHCLSVPEVRLLMDTPSAGMDIRRLSRPDMGVFVGMKKRRIATQHVCVPGDAGQRHR